MKSFPEYLINNSSNFRDNSEIDCFFEVLKKMKEYYLYNIDIKIIKIDNNILVIISILLRCDYLHYLFKLEKKEQKW